MTSITESYMELQMNNSKWLRISYNNILYTDHLKWLTAFFFFQERSKYFFCYACFHILVIHYFKGQRIVGLQIFFPLQF